MNHRTLAKTKYRNSTAVLPIFGKKRSGESFNYKAANESRTVSNSGLGHNFGDVQVVSSSFKKNCPLGLSSPSYCPFGGACHTCPTRVQTKLKVNEPGDKYEQEAESDEEEEKVLQTKAFPDQTPGAPRNVQKNMNSLRSMGKSLPMSERSFFEQCFGYDFSPVRVHDNPAAHEIADSIGARACTYGNRIIFGRDIYSTNTTSGRQLIAHELTHVVQQGEARRLPQSFLSGRIAEQRPRAHYIDSGDLIQRKCIADNEVCTGGAKKRPSPESKPTSMPTKEAIGSIPGSPGGYSAKVIKIEQKTRKEAKTKPPEEKRKEKKLHGRRAFNLERLGKEAGLEMDLVHGVFVDLYMASGGKLATCSSYLPTKLGIPYKGDAKKKCIIVSDTLEKQAAYYYLNPKANKIPVFKKGSSGTWQRDNWRSRVALRLLEHELQHHRYDTATHPDDPGGACTRNTVVFKDPVTGYGYKVPWYLSELSAILSEFPLVYRNTPPPNRGLDSAPWALRNAIVGYVENEGESICGALTSLRCSCDCNEVDTYVRNTFKFTSAKWKEMERIYLNDILSRWRKGACKGAEPKKKRTDLDWPIKPSSKQLAELQKHLDVCAFGVPPRWEKRPLTLGLGTGGLGKSAGLAFTVGTEWGFSSDQLARIAWMGGPRLTGIVGSDSNAFLAGVRFGFEYRNDIRRGGFIVGSFGEAGAAFEKPISGPETSGLWDMYLQAGGYAGYRFKPGVSVSGEAFGGSTLGIGDASKKKLWGVGVRIGFELPSFSGSK